MRDALLLLFLGGALLTVIRYPYAGLLLWAWFVLATPQQAAYAADQLPLNLLIAAGTIFAFFLHTEYRRFQATTFLIFALLFMAWLFVAQTFSLAPGATAVAHDRFWKIMLFVVLTAIGTSDRLRFHALLWVYLLVMALYAAKGAAFGLLYPSEIYYGLDETILYDNNHIGIALAATLPLYFYLAARAPNSILKWGAVGVAGLCIGAVLATHSRGAFITLVVALIALWWRSRFKISGALAGVGAALLGLALLPSDWVERMATIAEADEDASFQGRLGAWEVNWRLALDNPFTGAGLRAAYEEDVVALVSNRPPLAAHSIYFEVLGGTGFIGLFFYLGMILFGVWTARHLWRRAAKAGRQNWRADFAKFAEISLIAFAVGGASVSMEMWEGYLIVLILVAALPRLAEGTATDARGNTGSAPSAARIKARVTAATLDRSERQRP
ncbi:hypothetical protein PB2503_09604 [Parvularcula bermudensis HTCC2503]|uniref:O-antigen polymerase n=1 Tax=Parvularcula bermudensis (strain ATCC BAA-594 / HTCC2503 / KCTC 12087) TaxID=314260 RepID=E0TDQ7_PARBH|nr:putative O-glycosylation ligase, exosortase A system-associated [Parvularcula bermudensis]ADM09973.1 hypothetical protein PB2503_09604 [Parvularcula bermudensis HTCC2503]